ncbi:hypothetical protein EDD80_105214 [Anseongella ginsenosidimutans]|uniref:Uncharacterized protein n=2 Tax=Anseongella ginsenosidimutans TaxID=496056 RepID=A0A4R3KSI8_9SPHI|nr:hypothetical protein EDD80_105214 [Anseongella ginsenosidimutans]
MHGGGPPHLTSCRNLKQVINISLNDQGIDIDTLRVRDSTKVGYYRHFTFYIDGVKQNVLGKEADGWRQSVFY